MYDVDSDARLCIVFSHTSCISATVEVLAIKRQSNMDTILGGGLGKMEDGWPAPSLLEPWGKMECQG